MEARDRLRSGATDQRRIVPLLASLEKSGVTARCKRDDPLWSPREHSEWWCCIIEGAAASCVNMSDGRRHVSEFLFPGDLFAAQSIGFGELYLQAISSPTVCVRYPRESVERIADTDPRVAREIREATSRTIARLRVQSVVLGHASALEKMAGFLLDMTARCRPRADSTVALPMSRSDIADHLGLATETVSRVLTELQVGGAISLHGRRVQIMRWSVLEQLRAGGAPPAAHGRKRSAVQGQGSARAHFGRVAHAIEIDTTTPAYEVRSRSAAPQRRRGWV
jgi:CRP/FNR family transcriptional regulator, nitrogen fixation regulation protein